jgi:hypothetical protein
MALQTLSEYRITFAEDADGNVAQKVHMAATLTKAAQDNETPQAPVVQITRLRTGVTVDVPEPVNLVRFVTQTTPAGTEGIHASPSVYVVPAGTEVIFEALSDEGSGFVFQGWYIGGTLESSDAIAKIAVPSPAANEEVTTVEARFIPA